MKDVYEILDYAHFAKILDIPIGISLFDRNFIALLVQEGFLEYIDKPYDRFVQITEKGEIELRFLKEHQS